MKILLQDLAPRNLASSTEKFQSCPKFIVLRNYMSCHHSQTTHHQLFQPLLNIQNTFWDASLGDNQFFNVIDERTEKTFVLVKMCQRRVQGLLKISLA